ncbi:MAG: hypothetical protein EA401_05875 [Planctomycetota bacterium]|nr:MAG: hypothetical protein EA401_05875 [Planctomycetota bacterium]
MSQPQEEWFRFQHSTFPGSDDPTRTWVGSSGDAVGVPDSTWRKLLAAQSTQVLKHSSAETDRITSASPSFMVTAAGPWADHNAAAYRPVASLGSGGMGSVFLAWQSSLRRQVAVKVAHPRVAGRLLQEGRIAALVEHPGVVPVHEAGPDWLVMRRIPGDSLAATLPSGPVPLAQLPEAIERLARVAETLQWSHQQGVVHRDIKPENIMVGGYGEVLLIDWGLALHGSYDAQGVWYCDHLNQEVCCAGTPVFVAPEQARGQHTALGPATDVYLLAGVLYQVLTGEPPHHATGGRAALRRAAANDWRPPQAMRDDCPTALAEICAQGLHADPAQRPSAENMAGQLRAWLQRSQLDALIARAVQEGNAAWQAALRLPQGRERYPLLQEARQHFGDALAWDSNHAAAQSGIHTVISASIDAALWADDLSIAAGLLEQADEHSQRRYEQARRRRDTQARRRRLLQVSTIIAAAVLATVAWWWWWQVGQAEHQLVRERHQLAEELLAQPATDPVLQRAIAQQAMGLIGPQAELLKSLEDAEYRLFKQALEANDWSTAQTRLQSLEEAPATDEVIHNAHIAMADALSAYHRHQRQEHERRQQRLQAMRDYSSSQQPEYWDQRISAEVAGWDGDAWAPEMHAWSNDSSALLRRTAALVFALRPDVDDLDHLRRLLDDPVAIVRESAAQALLLRDDHQALQRYSRQLFAAATAATDMEMLLAVWEQAIILGPWLPFADDKDLSASSQELWQAWLRFDWQGVAQALANDADRGSDAMRLLLCAWAFAENDALAVELAQELTESIPEHPLAWMIMALTQSPETAPDTLEAAHAAGASASSLAGLHAYLALRSEGSPEIPLPNEDTPGAAVDRWNVWWWYAVAQTVPAPAETQAWMSQARIMVNDYERRLQYLRNTGAHGQRHRLALVGLVEHPFAVSLRLHLSDSQRRLHSSAHAEQHLSYLVQHWPDFYGIHYTRLLHTLQKPNETVLPLMEQLRSTATSFDPALPGWHMELTRALGDPQASAQAAKLLARNDDTMIALRMDLEDGRHQQALERLLGQRQHLPADLLGQRAMLDTILLTIPELRQQGWPGAEGHRLALLITREAVFAAEAGDQERAHSLIADAHIHSGGDHNLAARTITWLQAVLADEPTAAREALADLTAEPIAPWPDALWLSARIPVWKAHMQAASKQVWPLPSPPPSLVSADTLMGWWQSPLQDWRQPPQATIQGLWREWGPWLPPPASANNGTFAALRLIKWQNAGKNHDWLGPAWDSEDQP